MILSEGDSDDVGITDTERMQVNPSVTAAGGRVEAVFPNQEPRGPSFMVERLEAGVWEWQWAIHSEPGASEQRVWSAHEFMRQGVERETDQMFTSEEPHDIPVPDTARPGTYRVCTVGLPDKPCAEFEIASP